MRATVSNPRYWARLLLFACLILAAAPLVHADTANMQDPGRGLAPIPGKWQFRTGDDLAWAQADYDDSAWEQLSGDAGWGAQSHHGYTGFAWYRKSIDVSGDGHPLAVLIPPVDDAYEIYWNGRKIGNYGDLPPHAEWWARGHSVVYPLGTAPVRGVLALRVWKATLNSLDRDTGGGLESAPKLGDPALLRLQSTLPFYQNDERSLPRIVIATVLIVIGLLILLLFLRDRKQRLYLWLAIYLTADGIHGFRRLSAFRFGFDNVTDQLVA